MSEYEQVRYETRWPHRAGDPRPAEVPQRAEPAAPRGDGRCVQPGGRRPRRARDRALPAPASRSRPGTTSEPPRSRPTASSALTRRGCAATSSDRCRRTSRTRCAGASCRSPTIAMVHGYCIFGGWMIASAMDLIFAAEDAMFLRSNHQYFSAPWDIHPRKAKELLYEARFIDGREAQELGLVNRVYPADELEVETMAYANRVAENDPFQLRMTKLAVNQAQEAQGFHSRDPRRAPAAPAQRQRRAGSRLRDRQARGAPPPDGPARRRELRPVPPGPRRGVEPGPAMRTALG